MTKIHAGHTGIEKSKAKARNAVYWPNMTRDIENYVGNCKECLKYQAAQPKEPMTLREVPELPWQFVASDIGEYGNTIFLVVIDYYSKYIEAQKMPGKRATDVIKCLKNIFARHGYPEKLVADNMPYKSAEMKNYADSCNFKVETISPTHSQSNGLAERAVSIVKNILRKGCDLDEGLMEHRNTPISNFPYSPNQMLFSRQVRTKLPVHPKVLVPDVCSNVRKLLLDRQEKTKLIFDRGSKPLNNLTVGDNVRFKKPNNKYYSPAKVLRAHESPRSYIISDETGRLYRRNRKHLHFSKEPDFKVKQEFSDDVVVDENPVANENSTVEPRRSARTRTVPAWHKDYVV